MTEDSAESTDDSSKSIEDATREFYGEFFNENSVAYLEKSAGSRWFRGLLQSVLREIDPATVRSVADFGCGIGHKTLILREYFVDAEVSGFDFNPSAIDVASTAYGPKGIEFSTRDLAVESGSDGTRSEFDIVAAFDVLEHVDDWDALLDDICDRSRRAVLISVPVGRMRAYEVHIGHFRNYQKGEIEEAMRTRGFSPLKTVYAGFPFFSPILREMTQVFFKNYSEVTSRPMSRIEAFGHRVWYFLFQYCSSKKRGDIFIGLFSRD